MSTNLNGCKYDYVSLTIKSKHQSLAYTQLQLYNII